MKTTTQLGYLRLLGNSEEELCFLVGGAIETLKLNLDNTKKMRKSIGKTYAKRIKEICEQYLRGKLMANN